MLRRNPSRQSRRREHSTRNNKGQKERRTVDIPRKGLFDPPPRLITALSGPPAGEDADCWVSPLIDFALQHRRGEPPSGNPPRRPVASRGSDYKRTGGASVSPRIPPRGFAPARVTAGRDAHQHTVLRCGSGTGSAPSRGGQIARFRKMPRHAASSGRQPGRGPDRSAFVIPASRIDGAVGSTCSREKEEGRGEPVHLASLPHRADRPRRVAGSQNR